MTPKPTSGPKPISGFLGIQFSLSVIAFYEKAGRSQVGSSLIVGQGSYPVELRHALQLQKLSILSSFLNRRLWRMSPIQFIVVRPSREFPQSRLVGAIFLDFTLP